MRDGRVPFDLTRIRARLQRQQGRSYWRSLEEASQSPEFLERIRPEFSGEVTRWTDHFSRRSFLKAVGATAALAGLSSCTRPPTEKIVPYVRPPEQVIPGRPIFFATAMPWGGIGRGVLVESHEGRPTKIEGNPDHPESLGAANVFMQAATLNLYDPDRAKQVTLTGEPSTWGAFNTALQQKLGSLNVAEEPTAPTAQQGSVYSLTSRPSANVRPGELRVRILTETITSPTLAAQIAELQRRWPSAKWHTYDPVGRDNTRLGAKAATGQDLVPIYHLEKAKIIVSLESDFLFADPGSLRYSRKFMDSRRVSQQARDEAKTMNRLYVVEGTTSITGSMADHRLPMRSSEVGDVASLLAKALSDFGGIAQTGRGGEIQKWVQALAEDLKNNKGASLVLAGEGQGPDVHATAHEINAALGNIGKTVEFIAPIEANPVVGAASLKELTNDLNAGTVDVLLILGGNPVYTAPTDIDFGKALQDFSAARDTRGQFTHLTAHLGLYEDETSLHCQWHLPETHFLEMWGDVRSYDGTVCILQPLIAPLYAGKSAIEVLSLVIASKGVASAPTGYEIVLAYWAEVWRKLAARGTFDDWWHECLRKGVMDGTAFAPKPVQITTSDRLAFGKTPSGQMEIVFQPDYSVWDGSFTNNGWLLEVPRPLTHITWDNAALISPRAAERLDIKENGAVVSLTAGGRTLEAWVWIVPGHADETITLHLGYGRTRAGRYGVVASNNYQDPVGFNANRLRTSDHPWLLADVQVAKLDKRHELIATHTYQTDQSRELPHIENTPTVVAHPEPQPSNLAEAQADLNNRKLIRTATLEEFNGKNGNRLILDMDQDIAQEVKDHPEEKEAKYHLPQLFPEVEYARTRPNGYPAYKWGMYIDLTACMGCNACVVACQAENNIPIVGKDQVSRGREMHWIRIDTYYSGSLDAPETFHEPVPCMQCENAPCELVCPVGATVHDDEGINNMVYNRCVGTRYCSNNCPYKVRHFNFYQYSDQTTESLKLLNNPDVTVRTRGVMEKCTYCIQRINEVRIDIEKTVVRYEERAAQAVTEESRRKILEELNGAPGQPAPGLRHRMLAGLQTACQQSCPTEAIIFGDLNDDVGSDGKGSLVRQLRYDSPLEYGLLEELNTKPRTRYLARITNPNPAMPPAPGSKGGAA